MSVLRSTRTAEGPASAATDPDHGSTHPAEDQKNMETNTTAAVGPQTEASLHRERDDLESALITVRNLAAVAYSLTVEHLQRVGDYRDPASFYRLPARCGDQIIAIMRGAEEIANRELERNQ